MLTCAQCRFENPMGAAKCARCGRPVGALPEAPSAVTLVDRAKAVAAVTVGAAAIATVTPPPAAEPATVEESVAIVKLPPPSEPVPPAPAAHTPAPRTLTDKPAAPQPVTDYPRLVVVRGEQVGVEYMVLEGRNYIGRSAEKAVDIDLEGQEAVERTWASRQHAAISLERGTVTLEDLNSLNGTFINRDRVHPGQVRVLRAGDVVQIGTVQLRLME